MHREKGEGGDERKGNEVLGAPGRNTLYDNRELLFTAKYGLALVINFFSARKSDTSHTSKAPAQEKQTSYISTRPRYRKLVHDVKLPQ